MKPDFRYGWDQEDRELAEEFREVSEWLGSDSRPCPEVSRSLGRRIRRHARYSIGDDFQTHWIASRVPQLALAALLLFGIGLYYVSGLDAYRGNEWSPVDPVTLPDSVRQERVVKKGYRSHPSPAGAEKVVTDEEAGSRRMSSGHSWVRLKFVVGPAGHVVNIRVIESCVRMAASEHCIDDDIHDDYAIRQVMSTVYDSPGEMEEIIFIPEEYRSPNSRSRR